MSHGFDNFITARRSIRHRAQHHDNLLGFRSRVEQPDGAHFTIGPDFVDVEFFHKSLIGFRRFVADLLALFHERFVSLGVGFHNVRADIDAEVAVLVA